MSFAAVVFVSLVTTAVGQSASEPAAQTTTGAVQSTTAAAQTTTAAAASTPASASEPLPVSLTRIRKALDENPAPTGPKLKVDAATEPPVFRIHTESTNLTLASILEDGTSVPAYVRPPNGPYDYEFKQMVTPDSVKGCGRLSQTECLQYVANGIASGWLFQHATQKKKDTTPATPTAPDAETLRIRAQIQQELLDQQTAAKAEQRKAEQLKSDQGTAGQQTTESNKSDASTATPAPASSKPPQR
jgi:hypothetical protein